MSVPGKAEFKIKESIVDLKQAVAVCILNPKQGTIFAGNVKLLICKQKDQDQDQDSLLVKRRNDNHSPGPVIRELVPSSHQRSELSNTILCIFSE